MKRVLLLIDLPIRSQEAIRKAISTFQDTKEFVLVSVLPDTYSHFWDYFEFEAKRDSREKNLEKLRGFLSALEMPAGTKTDLEIIQGDPFEKLLELSIERKADIIILQYPIGSSPRELTARRLVRKLMLKSKVPVMIVN
ncbi:MAG: universal stress protein [Thermoplasmata archaeon]